MTEPIETSPRLAGLESTGIVPEDAGLWFLKGKLLIYKRDPAAEAALHRAVAQGIEESRVLAYLGQMAFERRDYGEVRRIFDGPIVLSGFCLRSTRGLCA